MKHARALPPLLVVDDDDNDALIFTRRIKDAGVPNPVLHFRHGGDAFVFLNQFCGGGKSADERPCVMFLDVNMPSLSGFDVLAWARQQPALREMKIIMVSGATEPWDAKIAAKLGADDYVPKFPDVERLSQMLGTHRPMQPH
jgi:CheY-like chemotaxis protein